MHELQLFSEPSTVMLCRSYERALLWVTQRELLIRYLIPTPRRRVFLTAVALPGIIHAIDFSNLLKSRFIEWKYIRFGRLPVDYVVGDLYMRISLAEQIEQYLEKHPWLQSKARLALYAPDLPPQVMRFRRLRRMYNLEWQLRYLHAFGIVMEHRFQHMYFDDELQKLCFYLSVYYQGNVLPNAHSNRSAYSAVQWKDAEPYAVRFYWQNSSTSSMQGDTD
ncbi:MAG: hypothetical protein RMJ87_11110 [Cytophagales bacterium]|nr:hypothetical protein [Bernardetiaceae bacterium]MDW8205568.1 hypothetical protein [Cytophagales bacterium]